MRRNVAREGERTRGERGKREGEGGGKREIENNFITAGSYHEPVRGRNTIDGDTF